MIVGTSGHIDHGKTSLVRAITGTDADRLAEEKRRGITIDLGFAYWPQPDGGVIGFVDVPGHEDYVRNMLAGATGIDALLLVVAANEGVKPQTLEHLLIADLLGLRSGVVALSKADLVESALLDRRQAEIRALLAPTGLGAAPIIPVSSVTGEGLGPLMEALRSLRADRETAGRPFRMAVDRVFTLAGAGTIVTGSIRAGSLRVGDTIVLSPSGREARVRGLHAQNRPVETAGAGERAAVNLAGIAREAIQRGDLLVAPELHGPTQRFDALVRLSAQEAKPLRAWSAAHLHAGAGAWNARIVPLASDRIAPGDTGLAQIVTDRPLALFGGDRVILRDAAGRRTIGGGIVLDIAAPERGRRRPERLAALTALAEEAATGALPRLLALPPHAVDRANHARAHGLSPEALDGVAMRENLLALGPVLMAPAVALTLSRRIVERLAAHHREQPDQPGLARERLRLSLPERLGQDAFAALVAHMIRRGEIAATGAFLRLPAHAPRLSREHGVLWDQIRPRLGGEARFKPPRVNELAEHLRRREESVRGLCKRLARRGDLFEVAPDHFLLREAVAELASAALATAAAQPDGWFTAAHYRDRIGGGRKMAILILEFFDRQGMTLRKDDQRRVDQRKAGMFG